MSAIYDNWKRLVEATLKKEKLREIALAESRETSFSSSVSAKFGSRFNFKFNSHLNLEPGHYADRIFACIHFTDHVIKAAVAATSLKHECVELEDKTQQLRLLLHQVARFSGTLYYRPMLRIMDDTEKLLQQALRLVMRCSGMRRMFSNTTPATFHLMSSQLEHSIRNVSWLLRDDEYLGTPPPIAADEPNLCYIWELIAILTTGSTYDHCNTIVSLISLAEDNVSRKLIVEEGATQALLRLLEKGKMEEQEHAARAIGMLGQDPESFLQVFDAGTCAVFYRILKEGPEKVQATVAWAVSELARNSYRWQNGFAQHNCIRMLIKHLSFNFEEDHSNGNSRTMEKKDEASQTYMRTMSVRALWFLVRGNPSICRKITETKALDLFAIFLEQGAQEVRYNSIMALMEITAVTEKDPCLRNIAFKIKSAIVCQLFRLIKETDKELLVPCVKTVGNLSRIFRATDTKMISPLVKLLEASENDLAAEVSKETCITLGKFASPENILSIEYSKKIIALGGINYLVQLVYFGNKTVQIHASKLLCNIARQVPERTIHAEANTLSVLKWALQMVSLTQDVELLQLLEVTIERLELYQSRTKYGIAVNAEKIGWAFNAKLLS